MPFKKKYIVYVHVCWSNGVEHKSPCLHIYRLVRYPQGIKDATVDNTTRFQEPCAVYYAFTKTFVVRVCAQKALTVTDTPYKAVEMADACHEKRCSTLVHIF